MNARRLIVLTWMLVTANAVWACPEAFISDLKAGRVPSTAPDVEGCATEYVADMAGALAAFTPAHSPEEIAAVVALVRDAHKASDRQTAYRRIATQLRADLPAFIPKESADGFEALDTLPALGVKPAAVVPPSRVDSPKKPAPVIAPQPISNTGSSPLRPRGSWRVIFGLFIGAVVLAAGAITYLLRRSRPAPATPKFEDSELGRRLQKLSNDIGVGLYQLTEKTQRLADDVAARLARTITPDDLELRLTALRDDLARLGRLIEERLTIPLAAEAETKAFLTPPPLPPPDPVALEHQVLGETWKHFRANKELSALLDNALRDSAWQPVIDDLGRVVPDDLKPTFEGVVAPCREHSALVRKLSVVPKIINGEMERLDVPKEVHRTREYTNLLTSAQSSTDVASRLNFRFKSWVTDTFLPFADLYLQRYQQAQLEKRQHDLQNGTNLVRQLLRIASVEPIDITPGETPFDSTRHIGRSVTNDPRFSDGVITGVVRNGFIERGQQVIRQPEVIVNRTR